MPELNESQHSQACAEEQVATATGTVLQLNRRAASEFNFIELQFQRETFRLIMTYYIVDCSNDQQQIEREIHVQSFIFMHLDLILNICASIC